MSKRFLFTFGVIILFLFSVFPLNKGAVHAQYWDHSYVETYKGYDIYYFPGPGGLYGIQPEGLNPHGSDSSWLFSGSLGSARNRIDSIVDSPEFIEAYASYDIYREPGFNRYYGVHQVTGEETSYWMNLNDLKGYIDTLAPPPALCQPRGADCPGCCDTCGEDIICCDPVLNLPEGSDCYCDAECASGDCAVFICQTVGNGGNGNGENGVGGAGGNGEGGNGGNGISAPGGNGESAIITILNPLREAEFKDIINNLVDFIFKLAITIVPLMTVYAGFLFITAGEDISKVDRAKRILTWTAIGFTVILLAKAIIGMIESILGI